MKISDYIVEFLIEKDITDVFGYPGGMVTHLMDSFSHYEDKIQAHVNYHEQGASFAACGYAQTSGKLGVAYATSGPGATNMMTGICNAYFDSIPVLFVTGQVNTFESCKGLGIRQNGFQETDILQMVQGVTKYAAYVEKPEDIRYELEKAYSIAMSGRKGPVLLDIPMNIQRTEIEISALKGYEEQKETDNVDVCQISRDILTAIKDAKRPCLLLGAGAKQYKDYVNQIVALLNVPTVSSMPAMDVLPSDSLYNYGFVGAYGSRVANFLLAKSDLVITIGTRLGIRQIGARKEGFAEQAKLIRIDIDADELGRKVKDDEVSYCVDAGEIMQSILSQGELIEKKADWIKVCDTIKTRLNAMDEQEETNYIRRISECLDDNQVVCTDVGQNQVWVAQAFQVKEKQRVLFSGGHGAMGYSLPAAIGAYYGSGQPVVSINGDGGVQMNLQELQFVVREQLPIKIIVLNNQALGMIRHFQEMYFDSNYTQTKAMGGYTTPDFVEISKAYGIPAYRVTKIDEITEELLQQKGPMLLEVAINKNTYVVPKLVYGKPNQDQDPPLDREIYQELMEL